ncbi:MAG: hypothetical protein RIQ79_1719 [Verrucomicrobiota bacterium]
MKSIPHTTRRALVASVLTAILASPAFAQTTSEVEALREQIRLLDQKLRVLERNIEIKDETAAADAKKLPKLTASEGRFEITSADGTSSLRLRGLVQADGRFYLDNSDAAQDGFLLRRARLIFEGKFSDRFSYVIQPEFAGSAVSILDANLNTAITPEFNILAGRFKTPVGLEQLQSDPVAFFNERSVATNLAPNRDVGVQFHGLVLNKTLSYQAAVTNGQIDGGNSPADSLNNEGDLTYSGRLFATPFVNDKDSALQGLGFGVGGATGNYRGSFSNLGSATASANPLLNAYRTDGQQTFFRYRSASSLAPTNGVPTVNNTTIADGTSYVVSPQAYFYSGPVGILAEYFYTGSDVSIGTGASLNARTLNNKAFNLSVGYVLTGEDAGFKGVTPKTSFNPSAGTWGAFEVVTRFAGVDIDDNAFVDPAGAPTSLANANNSATKVTTYGVGVNWYLSKTVRFGLDYFNNKFDLAPGGKPAPTATSGGNKALLDDEKVLIGRFQVSF